ncbi:MAG TPA: hypothetical protein DCX52_03585 [Massilia sp.]|nr:hypothetical protein [Massilia sp.]
MKIAGGTLAAAGLGLNIATAAASEEFGWSRANASALVGQAFWLNHPEFGALAVTLVSLQEAVLKKPDPRLDQFSLIFHAPPAPAMAEGTYDFDHPALGRFALHLTPAGGNGDHASYRSDFTLLN